MTAAAGSRIAINAPMPAIGHPDAPVFQVLAEVLSGDNGLLAKDLIASRNIATSARARLTQPRLTGHSLVGSKHTF